MSPAFDVIVFGASGFTGRLVAEYLNARHGVGGELAWAMAGRNLAKLAEVRDGLGIAATLPLVAADAADGDSMDRLVRQAKLVITTVGPYQHHGEHLITACARAGTDYVDLCGEPLWMAQMIPKLQGPAAASGARIVFSCGFDSIPFDLGVLYLQDEVQRRFGAPASRVRGRVRVMKGTMSGGTAASALATFERIAAEPALAGTMADPFALTPGFRGPAQPEGESAQYDEVAEAWTGPFVMATINTKNVHRTNALRGHPWGRDFIYDERMLTGTGPRGAQRARVLARNAKLQNLLLGLRPARSLIRRFALPQPGQGPDRAAREAGRYELLFIGQTADGHSLRAVVKGDRDPGYGSTSKLIAESALCLIQEVDRSATPGGVWTPGAAMGLAAAWRLQARAGLSFEIET